MLVMKYPGHPVYSTLTEKLITRLIQASSIIFMIFNVLVVVDNVANLLMQFNAYH